MVAGEKIAAVTLMTVAMCIGTVIGAIALLRFALYCSSEIRFRSFSAKTQVGGGASLRGRSKWS